MFLDYRILVDKSGVALFLAFLMNVSMITVFGTICSAKNLPTDEMDRRNDNVLGKSSSILYAIAMLASGQNSTITSTYVCRPIYYAGFLGSKDEEMAHKLDNKVHCDHAKFNSVDNWLVFRSRKTNYYSLTILSFELPFASFRFSSSVLGIGLTVINIYYLITTFVHWLIRSRLPKVGNVLIGIIAFSVMAIYNSLGHLPYVS
ncbi:hypothetical protein OSB04_020876 [Centaurea solstitialis]|uniref:Uncharacterized protein n=1 Tax=Centaurea solstitialis TaxID=347529 RepID=A0AA38TCS3_9ASTR|nr:hypothetical protein OSB04_020876 [Centaurea solstitialis]